MSWLVDYAPEFAKRKSEKFIVSLCESECRRAQDAKRDVQVNPFAFRSATAFVPGFAPLRGHGFGTTRLHHDPCDEWLDGVSDVLADFLRRFGKHTPSPLQKSARTLRLPGTCRPSLRSPWPAAQERCTVYEQSHLLLSSRYTSSTLKTMAIVSPDLNHFLYRDHCLRL